MKRESLIRRAVAAVLAVELLCAVAFCSTALWHEAHTRQRALDEELQGRSDSLLGAVQDAEDPDDNVKIDPTELQLPREDLYAVYADGNRFLGGSSTGGDLEKASAENGFTTVRLGGREYRLLRRRGLRIIDRAETAGVGLRRPVTILYATPMAPMWRHVLEASRYYVLLSMGLVTGATIALVIVLRRILRPLDELAAAAGEVTALSPVFVAPASALQTRELRTLAEGLEGTMKRLKDALAMQHRFVGDAAHELKTAVAVVRSSLQLVAMKPRSAEEYREGLARVLADNERVEALVGRMLTLARVEERLTDSNEVCDLSQSVGRTVEDLRPFAELHGVRLLPCVPEGIRASIAADAAQIVVSNLAVNAVQHSRAGTAVRVGLQQDGGCALLIVEDEGEGISRESLPHVFERFYREDRSRSRETGGVGLGLAICKNIAEAAGGSISIESEKGKGTKVRAFFRLA